MIVRHCDICGETGEMTHIDIPHLAYYDICYPCANTLIKALEMVKRERHRQHDKVELTETDEQLSRIINTIVIRKVNEL